MPALGAFLQGAVGEANRKRLQNESINRALQQFMQQKQIEGQIKSQQPVDPIAQQIKLGQLASAQESIFRAGGPSPDPRLFGGQTVQQPTQLAPVSRLPQQGISQPQAISPQGFQRSPLAPQARAPISQPGRAVSPQLGQTQRVPSGFDRFGRPTGFKQVQTPQAKLAEKSEGVRITKEAEALQKTKASEKIKITNISQLAGSFKEIADTYADAYREGGVGDLGRALTAKARLFFSGEQSESLQATQAFPGLKIEAIARLMPTLTQQGDKPGSVRLVQTIFEKLEPTFPEEKTAPKNAIRLLQSTLRNAYRFARAGQILGLTNESIEKIPDNQLGALSIKVSNIARNVRIVGAEKKALDDLFKATFSSIEKVIQERDVGVQQRIENKYGLAPIN